MAMGRHGVGPDQQVRNLLVASALQHLDEMWIHRVRLH
jgi:hypothetical protein